MNNTFINFNVTHSTIAHFNVTLMAFHLFFAALPFPQTLANANVTEEYIH